MARIYRERMFFSFLERKAPIRPITTCVSVNRQLKEHLLFRLFV